MAGVSEQSPEAYFRTAIEVSEAAQYVNTSIPAHYHYARFLEQAGRTTECRHHLRTAYTLAQKAQWERFVRNLEREYPELAEAFRREASEPEPA